MQYLSSNFSYSNNGLEQNHKNKIFMLLYSFFWRCCCLRLSCFYWFFCAFRVCNCSFFIFLFLWCFFCWAHWWFFGLFLWRCFCLFFWWFFCLFWCSYLCLLCRCWGCRTLVIIVFVTIDVVVAKQITKYSI